MFCWPSCTTCARRWVAVHVSTLCNHLAAVLVPPLVALRDVGVDLLVGWPVSLRIGLGEITSLHVKA
eukprot:6212949-Pleurochrysis_carterae.AAC.3